MEGQKVSVSNLDKELWPELGRRRALTKRDLLRYYARVSPWLLPHLAGRPLFATRFPDGIDGKSFFQKHWDTAPTSRGAWRSTPTSGDTDGEYLICENLATLLWLGPDGRPRAARLVLRVETGPGHAGSEPDFTGSEEALERSVLNYPDFVVFDLDPYLYSGREAEGWSRSSTARPSPGPARLALRIRDLLDGLGLVTFIKTSGRTGLHLYLPIVRDLDYDAARESPRPSRDTSSRSVRRT